MKDRFSGISGTYARFRPTYPEALYAALLAEVPARESALDCGTGNGQAALRLSESFTQMHATDISRDQLGAAAKADNLHYYCQPGDEAPPGIAPHSLDLITAAQSAHWFNADKFTAMAREYLKPGGIVAIWGYVLHESGDAALDGAINSMAYDVLGPYWDDEVKTLWNGYRDFPFPFTQVDMPQLAVTVDWSLDEVLGYFNSWSAVKKMREDDGTTALENALAEIATCWGEAASIRRLSCPIPIRAGRA